MPDRSHIGLDNPVFYGRLRTSERRAQSLGVKSQSAVRPSARYYNNDVIVSGVRHRSPTVEKVAKSDIAVQPKSVPIQPAPIQVVKPQPIPKPPLHTPQRSAVLHRQAVRSPHAVLAAAATAGSEKQQGRFRNWSKPQIALIAMAVIVFVVGIAVSALTFNIDRTASSQVAALSKSAATQPATTDAPSPSAVAGPAGVSTAKPSTKAVSSYVVAPDLPRYLDIPRFHVHSRILSLGILTSGALATPSNLYDTGWYNGSAKPADPPTNGAMLIDGHVAGWGQTGVFWNLKKLVAGDQITVTRGDGKVFTYQVVKSQTYDANNVDMTAAMTPVTPGKAGLNLITCAGDVDPHTGHFTDRIVVFAEQV